MRLVLHIGTEKTGTTAFQNWCHHNTQEMRKQSVWYAQSLNLPENRAIAVMMRDSDDREDGFGFFGLDTPEQHEAFVADRTKALLADVAAAKAAGMQTFLISSEHCHSRLRKPEYVERLAALLKPLFDEITVVAFIRPQVDMAQSLTSTAARVGLHVSRKMFKSVQPRNKYYNFFEMLERWADAFGAENVLPVPYKRHPQPTLWFTEYLSLNTDDFREELRPNGALDYRTVAMMNMLVGDDKSRPKPPRIMFDIRADGLACEEKLTFSRVDAEEIQEKFSKHNTRLYRAWPTIAKDDLEPNFDSYPVVGTIDKLDDADFGEVMGQIIGRANAELAFARGRVALLESKEEERAGNLKKAMRLMGKAIEQLRYAGQYDLLKDWSDSQLPHYIDRRDQLVKKFKNSKAK